MRTYLLVCLPAMASTCVLLAAFDRCASTSSLDRWRRLSSIQFAQRALILTMLFLLLLGSFHLFIFDIRNGTCASLPGFQAIISSLYGNIFVALLPHSGMIMFGIMTWKHLQQSKRRVATVSIPDDRILAVQRTNRQLLLMIFPYAFLASVIEAQRTATYTYSMLTSSAKKSVERQQIEYLILQVSVVIYYAKYGMSFYINYYLSMMFRKTCLASLRSLANKCLYLCKRHGASP
ncbi:unnamed protein product [Adineta ricciae]|uniref:G protein-coupled receptor n=1 Tax=Adineta ricciae TaxID=249248 RepID=A0A814S1F2_ADIRI|nr:unnamed protein product [Adineta ricciae]